MLCSHLMLIIMLNAVQTTKFSRPKANLKSKTNATASQLNWIAIGRLPADSLREVERLLRLHTLEHTFLLDSDDFTRCSSVLFTLLETRSRPTTCQQQPRLETRGAESRCRDSTEMSSPGTVSWYHQLLLSITWHTLKHTLHLEVSEWTGCLTKAWCWLN